MCEPNVRYTRQQLGDMHKKTPVVRYDPQTRQVKMMTALAAYYRYKHDVPEGRLFWMREPDDADLKAAERECQTA